MKIKISYGVAALVVYRSLPNAQQNQELLQLEFDISDF
jgi:hypothetical protein